MYFFIFVNGECFRSKRRQDWQQQLLQNVFSEYRRGRAQFVARSWHNKHSTRSFSLACTTAQIRIRVCPCLQHSSWSLEKQSRSSIEPRGDESSVLSFLLFFVKTVGDRFDRSWSEQVVSDNEFITSAVQLLGKMVNVPHVGIRVHASRVSSRLVNVRLQLFISRTRGIMDFSVSVVVIRNPEMIRVKNFEHFSGRQSFINEKIDPIFGKNIIHVRYSPERYQRHKVSLIDKYRSILSPVVMYWRLLLLLFNVNSSDIFIRVT